MYIPYPLQLIISRCDLQQQSLLKSNQVLLPSLTSDAVIFSPMKSHRLKNGISSTDIYQKAQPRNPIDGMKKVTFTQHCEITLALDMLARYTQRKLPRRIIGIGVSKACCDLCCEYLNFVQHTRNITILVRASHGKQRHRPTDRNQQESRWHG